MIARSDIKRSLLRVIVLVAVIFALVGIVAQNLATASLLEGRTVGGSHGEAASPPFAAHERLQAARGPEGGARTAHAIRWQVDRRPASRAQVSDGSVGRVHVVRLRGGLYRALTSSGGTFEMASDLPAPASRFTANGRWLHWTTPARGPARGYDHQHDAIHTYYVIAGSDAVLVHNACLLALSNWASRRFQLGNKNFLLDKSDFTHILERHDLRYWNGQAKEEQTFFARSMSTTDIENAIGAVAKPNRKRLMEIGDDVGTVHGTYRGKLYQLGVSRGHIGQFFPK